jgi:hypothetical protein
MLLLLLNVQLRVSLLNSSCLFSASSQQLGCLG